MRGSRRGDADDKEKTAWRIFSASSNGREYDRLGYLRLGVVLNGAELTSLQQRMDEIMLGQVHTPRCSFSSTPAARTRTCPMPFSAHIEATLAYRKVQGLESDPLFLDVIRRPLFREICGRHYGNHASISIFRAMMMNKPAGKGTYLPWHQDAGDVWKLDRDPTRHHLDRAGRRQPDERLRAGHPRQPPPRTAQQERQHAESARMPGVIARTHAITYLEIERAKGCCCTTGSCTAATSTTPVLLDGR